MLLWIINLGNLKSTPQGLDWLVCYLPRVGPGLLEVNASSIGIILLLCLSIMPGETVVNRCNV
jgi:hypothetical protein